MYTHVTLIKQSIICNHVNMIFRYYIDASSRLKYITTCYPYLKGKSCFVMYG